MNRATVLVVEDNAVTRRMLDVALGEAGFRVVLAPDGASALTLFQQELPAIVLQDLGLPDISGFRLVEQLRALPGGSETVIIAFTGFASSEENRLIAQAPFDGLLMKPVAPSRIVNTIAEHLGIARPRTQPRESGSLPEESALDLIRRAEIQASALGVLGSIADALGRGPDISSALDEILAQSIDAAGLSSGAILLYGDEGSLRCLSQVGLHGHHESLPALFTPELISEVDTAGSVLALTPVAQATRAQLSLLASAGASSAVIAGIRSGPRNLGLLFLTSSTRLLVGGEWCGFARAVAGQLGQALALQQAFKALHDSESRYRTLFETINLIALALDAEGRVDYVNPFFFALTGYDPAEVTGKSWFDFVPARVRPAMNVTFHEVLESGMHPHYENPIRTRAGDERLIAWHNTVIRDSQGRPTGTLSIGEDITELRQKEQQLIQAQKMEAIGQLSGGIAHDFNNLLAAISVFSELVSGDLEPGHPHLDNLDQIRQAVQRARQLTRQLLTFSRRQVLQPVVLDPNIVISDLAKMIARLIGENIELVQDLSEVGTIVFDAGQLEQVIMNLAVNARDAMPQGGRLTIATRRSGSKVVITISDTGTGMSEDVRRHAFEPFFTTKGSRGTGLGLATVQGIVTQSGGQIDLASEPGRGTKFTITIPGVATPAIPHFAAATEAMRGGKETILLVEDEPAVRRAATLVLRRLGYQVIEARNGAEALQHAQAHAGQIHLALSDVIMPGMDGPSFLKQLREQRSDVRMLLMSGYAGEITSLEGERAEIPLLAKPFTASSLAARVREVLDAPWPRS